MLVSQQEYNRRLQELEDFKKELNYAVEEARIAKKQGDLRENAEHDNATNMIAILTERIQRATAELADMQPGSTSVSDRVTDGCIVLAEFEDGEVWKIHLGHGAHPPKGEQLGVASLDSKLGQSVLGRHIGDVVSYVDNAFRQHTVKIVGIG